MATGLRSARPSRRSAAIWPACRRVCARLESSRRDPVFLGDDRVERHVPWVGGEAFDLLHAPGNPDPPALRELREGAVVIAGALAEAVEVRIEGYEGGEDDVGFQR